MVNSDIKVSSFNYGILDVCYYWRILPADYWKLDKNTRIQMHAYVVAKNTLDWAYRNI